MSLPVAILAGGLATRLRPVTEKIPKSLIEVAGRPFIDHQLELLARHGYREVVLCVGFLGDQIERHVGDGASRGVRIRYSTDGKRLLGTGGALRRALPFLGEAFFVLNGDSYLPCDYKAIEAAFRASLFPALMTVFRNEDRWDASNIEYANGKVLVYDKKHRSAAMRYIDYGLTALRASLIADRPADVPFDLADILGPLAAAGRVAGVEVGERFYEVGSPGGLAETDAYLRARPGALR